jgi:transcriptional regulator with XRE-family HTH domain
MTKAKPGSNRSPRPIDAHVGSRVRVRRGLMSMSQTDLGEALGISFQQIQKYEKGMNRIGASRLQQIADVLQVPVAWFFEGQREVDEETRVRPADLVLTSFMADRFAPRLMRVFPGLRLEVKKVLLDLMETVKDADARAKRGRGRA